MSQADSTAPFIQAIAQQVKSELAPMTQAIDREGLYPGDFMRRLGALGGFGAALPAQYGGLGLSLAEQIQVTTQVGRECGSTAFLVWCQSSCGWYLAHSPNEAVRKRYLRAVACGELLAGTGMSNAVKHLAGIEKIHLRAQRDGDGYIVNGSLPWVSNVGDGHLAIVAASVEDEGYIMFAVPSTARGLETRRCLEFSGLEGTQTLNLRLNNVHVPADDVLAHPDQFAAYVKRIKPGFVVGQVGMGFGIIEGCLAIMRESNAGTAHVNIFLDDQESDLADQLAALKAQAAALARQAQDGETPILPVLKLRAAVSELTLKAANSAALHAGAKGYLMLHPAQRRLREAIFVAIVTPALKHLRKEIHDIDQASALEAATVQPEQASHALAAH
ncbi:acyl-CoA dehydrogenase family protein [Eoetvoesiella caeni]|uniref:Alkylation response protein AidB-like acyl-CoA dehydrogenase n=1 Tax=Eoetvoesiella caeni TaxID=645616 RepID=A0A366HBZ2_9BURK|nr:acyl-CoA dehydrogenase family protein [Eoetvoesiella caeni]MCI2809234.1 acyl-CoA/acyl-ACP dehydrogenase [Eoetvoesiella caeni]RBP39438.1 alkylation response protein AidB-like acyl-CoA dehydrogenase [Eoetvoesiella caeni]